MYFPRSIGSPLLQSSRLLSIQGVALATCLVAFTPVPARADPERANRWSLPTNPRYLVVKGGGLAVGGEDGPEGMWLGFEMGATFDRVFDLGVTLDWFHRAHRQVDVIFESGDGYQPPIRAEVTTFETATDLVPFGISGRLKMPRDAVVRPFVSGTLGFEVLCLQAKARSPAPQPGTPLLDRSEWFGGLMWQAAAGIECEVSRAVSLVGEVGVHRGEPSQEARLDGEEVDLRVRMHGAFVRAGVRMVL